MKAFDVLPGWAWAFLCAGAISTAAINAYKLKAAETIHAKQAAAWQAERANQAAQYANAHAEARLKEQAMQAAADKVKQEKAREINRLNRMHADALDGLRNRPDRPSENADAVPKSASDRDAGTWCNGGQLYREDGAFLIGEAVRADQIRLQLAACQAAYDSLN